MLRYVGAGDDINSGAIKSRVVSKRRPAENFRGSRILAGDPSLYSGGRGDASGRFSVAAALSPLTTVSFPEPHTPALENAMCCLELFVFRQMKKARSARRTSAAPTPPTDAPAIVPVLECWEATGAAVAEA